MDHLIRATAADDQVRAFAADSAQIVEFARAAHNTSPVMTAALGRLLTGGVMMGCMMKGDKDLLTLRVTGDGPAGSLTVTADSQGHVKGCAQNPQVLLHANAKGKLDVGGAIGKGTLQVIRDLGLKEPYVGSCALQTGEIAEDLTYYFTTSEQVPSAVGLGVLMNQDNTVRQAGGFILQLMPGTSEEVIGKLEERLSQAPPVTSMLDSGLDPEGILEWLLKDLGLKINGRTDISYRCDCSRERFERALVSLGEKELTELSAGGENVDIDCRFCGKHYSFSPADIQALLASGRRARR